MHFYKLSALGQDYMFFDGSVAEEGLGKRDIKAICDRTLGAGAMGIFVINQKEPENAQIRGFCENGENMRETSTALICACLGANIATDGKIAEIKGGNKGISARLFPSEDEFQTVICDIKATDCDFTERKTELGNRILTLTHIRTTGDYLIHFTGCMDLLNFTYMSQKAAALSSYGQSPSLLLVEKVNRNHFRVSRMLHNDRYIVPFAGGFAAAAVYLCNSHRCGFSDEIKIECGDFSAYAVCKEDNSVMLYAKAGIIYEGNI